MKALADRDEEFEVFVVFPFFLFQGMQRFGSVLSLVGVERKTTSLCYQQVSRVMMMLKCIHNMRVSLQSTVNSVTVRHTAHALMVMLLLRLM
jgi:hypothetical protein